VYNAILRRYPTDVFDKFSAGGNLFATTIHVLVSAVIRLARATRLPSGLELYRGLGGRMELPDSFLRVDANGCRGYAEWGFLSTTSNKAVAVEVPPCPHTMPTALRVFVPGLTRMAGGGAAGVGVCGRCSTPAWCRGGRRPWCCG
jgi:hypothetical protein